MEAKFPVICFLFILAIFSIQLNNNGDGLGSVSSDRQALMDLYEATGGASWSNNSGWGSGNPDGSWYGVEVNSEGRVVRLDLSDNNLYGSLPESIGSLTKVQYFNVKQNKLTGEVPSAIGRWGEVESLLLSGRYAEDPREDPQHAQHPGKSDNSGNNFSGKFPDVWNNFGNLKYVELSGSSMTRIMYDSIGEARELLQIHINWNTSLEEKIPTTLNNLAKLQKLYLRANALTGSLPSLSNLTDLRFLHVGNGNALTGELPDFRNNTMLRELILDEQRLNGGGFTGDWPHYWNNGTFDNLITLRATHSYFTGSLHEFGNLDLKTFAVNGNDLQGTIPKSITSNNRLILLGLGWNNFEGEIPQDGWKKHTNTRYLRFNGNNLEGPIPDELPDSPDLKYLYFGNNNLSGTVSTNHGKYADSGQFPEFNYMNIGGNNFSSSDYQDLLNILGNKLVTEVKEDH